MYLGVGHVMTVYLQVLTCRLLQDACRNRSQAHCSAGNHGVLCNLSEKDDS